MSRLIVEGVLLTDAETFRIECFIKRWRRNPHTLAILLTGSHAIDLADKYSDVDLYVILSDPAPHRQRGDDIYDNVIIEYNADPIPYIVHLMEEQHRNGLRHCARKIQTGKVLFQRGPRLAEIRTIADEYMSRPFPQQSKTVTEMAKYYIWDQLEDLRRINERNPTAFPYAYFCGLQNVINYYAKFQNVETLRPVRMHQFLTDPVFRKKYRVGGFKDAAFVKLAAVCMENVSFRNIGLLTELVQQRMGGFVLDGWKLRAPV